MKHYYLFWLSNFEGTSRHKTIGIVSAANALEGFNKVKEDVETKRALERDKNWTLDSFERVE